MLDNKKLAQKVEEIMNPSFPLLDIQDSCQDISSKINKDNSAVLIQDSAGEYHIITEYDLIQAMA